MGAAGRADATAGDRLRRAVPAALLLLVSALGFQLRTYHIDAPSIAMHNMKENEYLSAAIGMRRHGDYLRRRTHISGLDEGPGYFEDQPQMPLLPWAVLACWKLLGPGFWQARLLVVLAACASIPALYVLGLRLSGDRLLGGVAAVLLALVPEHVFFGRNLQPEAPALLCALLGSIRFLDYLDARRPAHAFQSAFLLGLAGLFKYTFLILCVPLVAVAWGERGAHPSVEPGRRRRTALLAALGALPLLGWSAAAPFLNTRERLLGPTLPRVHPLEILSASYWRAWGSTIGRYAVTNHTPGVLLLFGAGVVLLCLRGPRRLALYGLGTAAAAVPYGMLLSSYLRGHAYYQFPFLPLVCLVAALPVTALGDLLATLLPRPGVRLLPCALLLALLPSLARYRHAYFDAVFYGLDVAARYLSIHSDPGDRLFVFGHQQSLGICANADRRCAWNPSPEDLRRGEERLGFRWVFIHAATRGVDRLRDHPEALSHVEAGYEVVQMTFFPRAQGAREVQGILLRRGGSCDLAALGGNPIRGAARTVATTYETTGGPRVLLALEKD